MILFLNPTFCDCWNLKKLEIQSSFFAHTIGWPKCCQDNQIYNTKTLLCQSSNVTSTQKNPEAFKRNENYLRLDKMAKMKSNPGYSTHLNVTVCPSKLRYFGEDEELSFLSNGHLYSDNGIEINVFENGFCLENFYLPESGEVYWSGFLCSNAVSILKLNSSVNSSDYEVHNENFTEKSYFLYLRMIYTVSGLLSLVFLLLAIFLYVKLPDLDNFQGEITTIYLSSIFITTFLLTLSYNVKLKGRDLADNFEQFIFVTKNICAILGYSIYFSAIFMFCWMSVLSFDLFWSFSYTSIPLKNQSNKFKQICYYAFGFGTPTIMTASIILLDLVDKGGTSIIPNVGEDSCFLAFQGARFFFYIPMSILLIANLIFYLTTLVSLCKSYRTTHIASRQRRNPRIEVSI
jgi:hypothetical protein